MICPTVATAMISHGIKWNLFYLFMVAVTSISLGLSAFAFRMDTPHAYNLSISISHDDSNSIIIDSDDEVDALNGNQNGKSVLSSSSTIVETLKSPLHGLYPSAYSAMWELKLLWEAGSLLS